MKNVTISGLSITFSNDNEYMAAADAFIFALRNNLSDCTILDAMDQEIFNSFEDLEDVNQHILDSYNEDVKTMHVLPTQQEYISYALEEVDTNRGSR